ncbi:MAG: hypothetical protein GTO49_21570, partial [Anaerolineae bacterium]|nr:hypothetical protein [Anaerolineae bacterium]
MTAGAVRVSNQDTSPSFIGETAFIIARNLLESEKSLNKGEGILHVATPKHHVSPYHMVADDTQ